MSLSLKLSILLFAVLAISFAQLPTNFDYLNQGTSGYDWESQNCTALTSRIVTNLSPLPLSSTKATGFNYYSYFFPEYVKTETTVTNYNITLELNSTSFGKLNTVTAGKQIGVYEAVSIRLHSDAEHTIDGTRYPVELQIYHQLINSKEPADLYQSNLFVSVFFDDSVDSTPNILLGNITDALTSQATNAYIDLSYLFDLSSTREEMYSYGGTQTMPPCYPASWIVFPNAFHASADQIKAIYDLYHNNPNFSGNGNYRVAPTVPTPGPSYLLNAPPTPTPTPVPN